jgi:4-hydroxy-2,2'-bipyrrole-5-carbaldehyde O-methyltransferase
VKLGTLLSVTRGGRLGVLFSVARAMRPYHRLAFIAAGLSSGLFAKLANGPVSLEHLAAEFVTDASMRDGLEAWLQLGVALGELRGGPGGYGLRGRLSRRLVDVRHDAAAALVEEVVRLHNTLIIQTPSRLREGRRFALADQEGRLIARSSRVAEPFIGEAVDAVVPVEGAVRLLEIGCGSAVHIRRAAARNAALTALGLELQPDAAALGRENLSLWGLDDRVTIEVGDVMKRAAEPAFDLATLHQNIYYFPIEARAAVLRHVRAFLKPGGRLLLTTVCRGRGAGTDILNLWGAMTAGCGRLPTPAEMVVQMKEAGFADVRRRRLIPGESFYSFVGATA